MPIDIKVPSVGESVTEGRIARWLKPDGAAVQRDEMVCELETDKATAEVAAPAAGVLRHAAKEGDTVSIGAVIGSIDPAGVPAAAPSRPAAGNGPAAPRPAEAPRPSIPEKKVPVLMPAARRAAEEEGIDLSRVPGPGRGGGVLKEDVMGAKGRGTGERGASATGAAPAPPRAPAPAASSTPVADAPGSPKPAGA